MAVAAIYILNELFGIRSSPRSSGVNHAPPPAPAPASSGESMVGGLDATITQASLGVASETESAVAHRAVDAVMDPHTIQHESAVSDAAASAAPVPTASNVGDACGIHSKAFQDCLNSYGSDMSKCQFYIDTLNECRRNRGSLMGA